MKLIAAPLLFLAAAASAQVVEGEAIKPTAATMRAAWKASPKQAVGVTLPLYGRVVLFDMLRDFVPAYQAQNGRNFLMEYLPDGQTFDNWTQMVTVTSGKDASDPSQSNTAQAAAIFGSAQGCAKGSYYQSLGQRDLGERLSVVTISRGCAQTSANAYAGAKAVGEQNLILFYRDERNTYTIQYATRGAFKTSPPIAEKDVSAQIAKFGNILLCRKDSTEARCQAALGIEKMRAANQ